MIFTSDHGYMQGEHRIPQGKMVPYDPSTQVPLLIRGPGIPRGRTTKALVGQRGPRADDHGGHPARPSRALDGRSFLPFARDPRTCAACGRSFTTTAGQGAKGGSNTREGGAKGHAAARAGVARGANHALAVRGIQGRAARAVRPEARPWELNSW